MTGSYLGIDPGLNGAFAILTGNRIRYKMVMPTISVTTKEDKTRRDIDREAVLSFVSRLPNDTHVAIEKQMAYRSQDVTSSCTICKNYGILLMALTVAHIDPIEVPVKDWQDFYNIISAKKAAGVTTKEQALPIAQALFPGVDFRKSDRSQIAHDGIVDAALIAKYCQSLFPQTILKVPSTAYLDWCDKQGVVEER